MIIYFEGADGTGKTTLIQKLHDEFGYRVIVGPERIQDKIKERYNWNKFVLNYVDDKYVYLIDRGPLTELVYRLSDNADSYIDIDSLKVLFNDCKIVLCDYWDSFNNAMKRGEDNITDENRHRQIRFDYLYMSRFIERYTNCKVMRLDTYCKNLADIVKFINE